MSLWGKIHRYRFRVNLAKRLNVKVSVRTSIMQLGLGEYVETVIREQGLTSVGKYWKRIVFVTPCREWVVNRGRHSFPEYNSQHKAPPSGGAFYTLIVFFGVVFVSFKRLTTNYQHTLYSFSVVFAHVDRRLSNPLTVGLHKPLCHLNRIFS